MRRNLISPFRLVKDGFNFTVSEEINFFLNSACVGSAFLQDDMWRLHCSYFVNIYLVEQTIGTKRVLLEENSSLLWHKRLGHISKRRLQQLVKFDILQALDFSDLEICVDCIKGKMTNCRKLGSTRNSKLLELIHTDLCGPFQVNTICGNKYFITFIDDFSRYCHIYLLSEKSQSLEAFRIYKTEVEKQLEKSIKVARSDRGGEYYGKYDEAGQHKGPFAKILEECGIVAQYTTPGIPEQNGVAVRRNRTLLNMVRSMMSRTNLPKFLWGETLKIANYISNRVPSKAIDKTPFEIWTSRKSSLMHFHTWGCPAEAQPYNLEEKN